MRFGRDLLVALGLVLLVVAAVELSSQAALAGVASIMLAYGICRRLALAWWAMCLLLALAILWSALDVFRGGRTTFMMMCSVLNLLGSALLMSWCWRQRPYFSRGDNL